MTYSIRKTLGAAALLCAIGMAFSCGKPEQKPNNDNPDPDPEVEKPVITAELARVPAQAGTYTIAYDVENPADGNVISFRLQEEYEWLTLTLEGKELKATVPDNLSAARIAKLTLSYPGADNFNLAIVQEQWQYSSFDINVSNIGPFGASVTVMRKPGYSGGYFFEVLDKASFLKYVEGETNELGSFAYGEQLYQSDLAYLNHLASQHGHPLGDLFGMLQSMYSKEETVTIPYSGLQVDSEYIFVVYGMEDSNEATRKTNICIYEFRTGFSDASSLSFTGEASDISETYATITVTPSNDNEYWYMDWVSEIQLQSTDLATVMQNSINNAKSLLSRYSAEQILCHGQEKIQATELMPGTEYSVVAWGMNLDMAATTEPKVVFKFRTNEYEIVDDCTFQIEVLDIEDMDIHIKVTPSNLQTRYYVAFVEKSRMAGYTDEQAAQRIINMESQRIEQHYYDVDNLSWANLPGLEAGVREIWGRRDEGWTFQPNHEYRIYVFGIDNFGIRSTGVGAIDVTTAEPGASNNHFTVAVNSVNWMGLDYTVTPEIADEYWMPFVIETSELDYYRNADGSLMEKEIMHEIEEYYEDEILYHTYTGTRTLHTHVIPDTQYSILVFGYSGSYTTPMYEWKVYAPAPPLGQSTADYSYTYELFRGEDLSALNPTLFPLADYQGDCIMVVRFTVSDNAAHWYFGCWPPVENFADQGGQYYLMLLDMDPNVAGSAMQDKKIFRNRPWWYGASENWQWVDSEGDIVNHWPWSLSGWAEDADGNYGPWHYELMIPVPVPKGQETGKYEVGYVEAYPFWENPSSAPMQVFRASDGRSLLTPMKH